MANATSQLALCSNSGTNMSFCCLAPGEDASESCGCMNGGSDQPVVVDELVATITVVATTTSGTSTIIVQPVKTTTLTGQPKYTGSASSTPYPAAGTTNKAALSSPTPSLAQTTSAPAPASTARTYSSAILSTGMIAGIGAGSAGFVIVIASVGFIMRRLKKKRQPPEFKPFVDDNFYTSEASLVKGAATFRPRAPRPPPLALSRPSPSRPLPPPPPPPPEQYPHQPKNARYTQQSRCELEANPAPVYELNGLPTPALSSSAFTEVPVMFDDR
jgi:hypothetical protein